jgi:asparagine synthase (glutamine-hydrolysing)
MCGICGQFGFADQEPIYPDILRRMATSITHRGPDDDGFYFTGSLGLGFRRLSIIDLAAGHQPMSDSEGKVWVVFNGEIYNFQELRSELQSRGHRFRTNCDTEVIVHGYKEYGTELFQRLNGMFGLAIWDDRRRRLVVARDAMGIKLVYYRLASGKLTFASEIRAILTADDVSPEIDPVSLSLFLRYRYTPSPLTIYRGIRKLAPGSMLVVENGKCAESRWYDYTPTPFANPKENAEAEQELFDLYQAAVERHLISDVPVGILLSGGVDSGLLLALMNRYGRGWPAYTIGYGDTFADDELADAADTAALLGARHIPIKLDREEFEDALPKIVEALEEPVTSSSIVPMYFVCRRAREDVKVALIGQGPDEVFGGYKRHLGVHYGAWWRGMPAPIRELVGSAIKRLPRNETLKRGVNALDVEDRLLRYQKVFCLAPANQIDSLFRPEFSNARLSDRAIDAWHDLVPQMAHTDELGGFQLLELRSSLPDELLMYADKLSMAHGLEVRVPYLDRTVVEFAQRLTAGFKVRNGKGKWLHRRVCERVLDPRILKRKKRGFAVNIVDDWFRSSMQGEWGAILSDESSQLFELLEPAAVGKLLQDHRSGRQDNYKLLFSLVVLEQWLRQTRSTAISGI